MRTLMVSILCLAVVIASWGIFVSYSDKNIHKLMSTIEEELLISISAEDWPAAEKQLDEVSKQWHKQKKIYSFFFNTRDLNDTDYSIARAKSYISARDKALASGELDCIREKLGFLHSNELITLDNVF